MLKTDSNNGNNPKTNITDNMPLANNASISKTISLMLPLIAKVAVNSTNAVNAPIAKPEASSFSLTFILFAKYADNVPPAMRIERYVISDL